MLQLTEGKNEHEPTKKDKIIGVFLIIAGIAVLFIIAIDWTIWPMSARTRPIDFIVILVAIGIILVICGVTYLVRTPVNRRDSWSRNLPYT